VFSHLLTGLALFAEQADPNANSGGGGIFSMLLPFILIGGLFYFMLIRPQKREQMRRQSMLSAIKKNDRVLTHSGIYGVVMNVQRESDEVTIRVDETTNTKLRVTLGSIAQILGDESSESTEQK